MMLTKFRELARYISGTAAIQFALGVGVLGFAVVGGALLFEGQLDGTVSDLATGLRDMFVR